MAVTAYLVSPSTPIDELGSCKWPRSGSSAVAGSKRLIWKIRCTGRSLGRSNPIRWLLIIFLTWYLPIWQFSSFLLGCLMTKFLVSNHIKSHILYLGAGLRYWLAWHFWLAYTISMLSCRIFWISSIHIAKALVLTSLILLGGGLAGSKPIQEWNFLFAKKRNTFVVFDLVLLPVNSARGSQSG